MSDESTDGNHGVGVVLIGGPARSGTGLMRRIVGSHPDVAIPSFEFGMGRAIESDESTAQVHERLAPRLDPATEPDTLPLGTVRDYFVELLDRFAHSLGRPIPGEKTPGNETHWPTLRDWFAPRRVGFIHMTRDPFDVIASHLNARWNDRQRSPELVRSLANEWVSSITLAAERSAGDPFYLTVSYDDVTSDPAAVATTICDAFGLRPEIEAMVAMGSYPDHVNSSFGTDIGERITGAVNRSVSRASHLTDHERQIIADVVR